MAIENHVYRGGLTRESFLFYEVRIVAKLIDQGKTEKEIFDQIIEENLFQFSTEKSIKTITSGCYKRLTVAGNKKLISIIANESVEMAKQASLYLLMRYNKIVWDFMVYVIGEKYKSLDLFFDKNEVSTFLSHLQQENENVAEWSEKSIMKIKSILVKCLKETGYIDSLKSDRLNPIFLYDEVLECIKENNDEIVFPAFNYLN